MMKGYMLFIIFNCLPHLCTAAAYGETCADISDCTDGNYLECDADKKCSCSTGYTVNGNVCNADLGTGCSNEVSCYDQNAECVGTPAKCSCKNTHYDDNGVIDGGTCQLKKNLGDECPDPNTVPDTCSIGNSGCSPDGSSSTNHKCKCVSPYMEQTGTCVATWSEWTNWGNCDVTCGSGSRTRTRTCPVPNNCAGDGTESQPCTSGDCPVAVDGIWGNWTPWSACSPTCGDSSGQQTRSRSCNNPPPSNGGQYCIGSSSDTQPCIISACSFNGGWTPWTTWGDCSVTCGGGTQTKSRTCTNPAPQYGGAECSGIGSDSQQCNTQYCPLNGGWTQWYTWGTCSVTCAGGRQTRSRSCTNPEPQYGGAQCSGSGSGTQDCSTQNCPVIPFGQPCKMGGDKCEGQYTECKSETCQCVNGYYWNGNNCVIKVGLGSNCPMPNACSFSRAACVGSECRCNNTYYDTNTDNTIGGSCETRINLGGPCSSNHLNNKQCIDQNASCRWLSSYICSCDERYHPEGSSCKPNVALGGNCQGNVNNECSDPNAECIDKKCTCSVGFYRFYEGSSQSNCRKVQELQVTGITFPIIKTTEFTVSWTVPIRSSYVSGYDVEWQSGDKVIDSLSPQKVTGLTPGKTYVVKVISKDTGTEPGDTRTTNTSKQQAAKPSMPGAVASSGDDLDALDRSITIRWTSGTGFATSYNVKLFDGDSEKGSRNTSSLSTTFNNVLNGYRYNVRVTARSQQFNGDYLWSETKVSPIKTKVQVSEAPRNGVCQSPKDSAITLDWDAPSLPNGDLVRYHIDVINTTSNKVLFRDKTTGTETQKVVGNLEPGTNYIFRLYTENEGYISTNYDQVSSSCKTRAKMSMKPENLQITDVTSRSFLITWDKPLETYSAENYGYVLQVKDDKGACKEEVLYKCSDCKGSFQ
ncbi:tenascin-like, partial [Ruditapes philippinarum]|uniref:tenascin-like n=1 Tax=Ruditapes philippinarum TaxID=129788 RepID=UPI00295A7A91